MTFSAPRTDTPSRWSAAVTSSAGTATAPSPPQAPSTASAAPTQEKGLSLSSDTTRFVTTCRSFERACSCSREPRASRGRRRSSLAASHGCRRHSAMLGRNSASRESIRVQSSTPAGVAWRSASQSGSLGQASPGLASRGTRGPPRSSQPRGCRPARSTKSRQPQDQTSSLGLGCCNQGGACAAGTSRGPALAPSGARLGSEGGRPARPRSVMKTCGEVSASDVEARSTLLSRRSPCTMLCGRSSWQCRSASNTCRMTVDSQTSPSCAPAPHRC
mmetsp:Transcript_19325/g.59763  ORF Transcript_19325/g.59763 Transcript_19325/m.59763 type:complete len:274 (-) Transcript_19325:682-1503(-)